jgi:rod shape-determining protein MreC
MGVINSLGIVGIENTSPNYATVISILNKKSQINENQIILVL